MVKWFRCGWQGWWSLGETSLILLKTMKVRTNQLIVTKLHILLNISNFVFRAICQKKSLSFQLLSACLLKCSNLVYLWEILWEYKVVLEIETTKKQLYHLEYPILEINILVAGLCPCNLSYQIYQLTQGTQTRDEHKYLNIQIFLASINIHITILTIFRIKYIRIFDLR